jgi:LysR family transcriptional regulator, chromosome initiation inhibitor
MHLDYPSLAALAAVVREGTFEAAARSLNITQSAVSQRIKALEEKTGAVLVVRGRPCVATEYGHRLIRHIE